jgi:hypothetical protein
MNHYDEQMIREIIQKVDSIASAMNQMERVLSGQETPPVQQSTGADAMR